MPSARRPRRLRHTECACYFHPNARRETANYEVVVRLGISHFPGSPPQRRAAARMTVSSAVPRKRGVLLVFIRLCWKNLYVETTINLVRER